MTQTGGVNSYQLRQLSEVWIDTLSNGLIQMSNTYELKVELVSHYLNLIRKLIIILIEIHQKVFLLCERNIATFVFVCWSDLFININ